MLLQTRPLYDNLGDSQFFLTPPEWDVVVRAVDRRLNVMVTGPRGVGKTTLLRQLQRALRDAGKPIAMEGFAVWVAKLKPLLQ